MKLKMGLLITHFHVNFPTLKEHIISLQKSYIIKARALGLFVASNNDEPCGHEVFHLSRSRVYSTSRYALCVFSLTLSSNAHHYCSDAKVDPLWLVRPLTTQALINDVLVAISKFPYTKWAVAAATLTAAPRPGSVKLAPVLTPDYM